MPTRVGLISDTHGLLRPQALDYLAGCDHIIHGGDIGNAAILEQLRALAPVSAVRGNNDTGSWAEALPQTLRLAFENVVVFAIHDVKELPPGPPVEDVRVVVSGHSHKPGCNERDGVLYVNPGSAGRRRFSLPIAVGELLIDGEQVRARIMTLQG